MTDYVKILSVMGNNVRLQNLSGCRQKSIDYYRQRDHNGETQSRPLNRRFRSIKHLKSFQSFKNAVNLKMHIFTVT